MISSLPDLSSLYSLGSPRAFESVDPSPPVKVKDPQADRADLSALAQQFAKQGGAFALFEFHYQSVHSVSMARDGKGVSRREFWQQSFEMDLTVGGDPEAAKALFAKIQEEFSPEKVADRIVGFALKGSEGKGNPFREFIQKAIELGYAQARQMLGPLDDKIAAQLEETMKRVREKMQPEQAQQDKPLEDSSIAA